MNKPFVVIDNKDVRFTDLGNGTTDILFKDTGKTINYENRVIAEEIEKINRNKRAEKAVHSYKQRRGLY